MSVRLVIRERSETGAEQKPAEVVLDDPQILLGREKNCQVVLTQPAVSRNHARISRDGQLFFVEDLGSAYGTLINGEKLPKGEKRLLRGGDVIGIAQYDVTFDRLQDAPAKSEAHEKTSFVARRALKSSMGGVAGKGEGRPYLRIMTGVREGEHVALPEAQELIIGRDEGVDLLFPDDDLISRRHAKIRCDWSGTHVEDLGSRNGIRVNRRRVTHRTLQHQDELEVGSVRFLYLDPNEEREAPARAALDLAEPTHHAKDEPALPPAAVPARAPDPPPPPPPPAPPGEPEAELAGEGPEVPGAAAEPGSLKERLQGLLKTPQRLALLAVMALCVLGSIVLLVLLFIGV